uniref:serine C-palmitoyltransferase n=1 Tax=Macrostomum lignano TaxID=282301 RepID=A0A1I8F3T7_9PLAT
MADNDHSEEPTPYIEAIVTYISYVLLAVFGHIRDFLRNKGFEANMIATEPDRTKSFVPLYQNFESFFTRNLYRRIRDCWNRPITTCPGAEFEVMDRDSPDYGWTFRYPGSTTRAVNFGSYNYLGFAESSGYCADAAVAATEMYGCGVGSSRTEVGSLNIHTQLERAMAEYLGTEDAIVFPMGFATNALNMAALLNHSSLVLGSRLTGATIKIFKHNNPADLEAKLREAIVYGQARTRRPFTKILIVHVMRQPDARRWKVEGVYSMEGSIVRLPEIIALKKRYQAYLYLDEAHSIGALGASRRGVVDYYGCDPRDVDVLMGTFTKSFGGAGGYIAGSSRLVQHVTHSAIYGASMPAPVAAQILTALSILLGRGGPPTTRASGDFVSCRSMRSTCGPGCTSWDSLFTGDRTARWCPFMIFMPARWPPLPGCPGPRAGALLWSAIRYANHRGQGPHLPVIDKLSRLLRIRLQSETFGLRDRTRATGREAQLAEFSRPLAPTHVASSANGVALIGA